MTKVQLKAQALSILADNKANKKLVEAVTALMEEFVATSKKDTVKREKVIERDGETYVWCNRHECYEPSTNFKTEKSAECLLATKKWQALGKMVNEAEQAREAAIEAQEYDKLPDLTNALNDAKNRRAGRYNHEDDTLQFNDIAGYDYNSENYIFDEQPVEPKAD